MLRAFVLLLLGSPLYSGYAADLPNCAPIRNDAERLACYDAWAAREQPAAAAAPISAPVTAAAPVAATTVTPLSSEQKFGIEEKIARVDQQEELHTRFIGEFRGWEPKQKFTFENGQVWQIADGSAGHYNIDNPEITISRGMFSAFFLHVEGLNKAPKIKRIK